MEKINQYHRYGHLQKVLVKVGDQIKKGKKIGTVGTGNGAWLAHLHRDAPKKFPVVNSKPSYAFYNIGWTKQETLEFFMDPQVYGWSMPDYDHLGLGWLQYWNYGTKEAPKMCYHPGVDENGPGSGNSDIGDDIEAVTDGIVVYCYDGNEKNGGWGKLLVIQETKKEEPADPVKEAPEPAVPESEIERPVVVTVIADPQPAESRIPNESTGVAPQPEPAKAARTWREFFYNLFLIIFNRK